MGLVKTTGGASGTALVTALTARRRDWQTWRGLHCGTAKAMALVVKMALKFAEHAADFGVGGKQLFDAATS